MIGCYEITWCCMPILSQDVLAGWNRSLGLPVTKHFAVDVDRGAGSQWHHRKSTLIAARRRADYAAVLRVRVEEFAGAGGWTGLGIGSRSANGGRRRIAMANFGGFDKRREQWMRGLNRTRVFRVELGGNEVGEVGDFHDFYQS